MPSNFTPLESNTSENILFKLDDSENYQKPSKWRYFFFILGIFQTVGIVLFISILLWLDKLVKMGYSGTEYIGIILSVTIVPALTIISLINLIGLPIYMRKNKLYGKNLIVSIVLLIISSLLILWLAYSSYKAMKLTKELNQKTEQMKQENKQKQQEFEAVNANPEITKKEAIQLLKSCKLKGLYYTNQTDKSNPANGGWGELSSTGVVLTKINGQPFRISIADKLVSELVPIAREAQKTCDRLQFWHDGRYEQYKDGKWYFKNEVVNSMQ